MIPSPPLSRFLRPRPRPAFAAALVWALAAALPSGAQPVADDPAPAGARPERIGEVDVVEKLNERVPLDAVFTSADGKKVRLAELVQGDVPVLLSLVYFRCEALCSPVLNGLTKAARNSGLSLGRDYRALTVSIDPKETPQMAKERQGRQLQALGAPDQDGDWAFAVGEEAEIGRLADAVGFRYRYDQASDQYAHAAAFMVLTPDGRVSRYLYGVEFPPRDVKFALIEAAGGRAGTSFDRVILNCFKYDPNTRRYELYIFGFIRGGALLVFGALAATLAVFWRREYKRGTIR